VEIVDELSCGSADIHGKGHDELSGFLSDDPLVGDVVNYQFDVGVGSGWVGNAKLVFYLQEFGIFNSKFYLPMAIASKKILRRILSSSVWLSAIKFQIKRVRNGL